MAFEFPDGKNFTQLAEETYALGCNKILITCTRKRRLDQFITNIDIEPLMGITEELLAQKEALDLEDPVASKKAMSQQTGSYKIILDKEAFELLKETPVLNELNNHLKTQYQKYNN